MTRRRGRTEPQKKPDTEIFNDIHGRSLVSLLRLGERGLKTIDTIRAKRGRGSGGNPQQKMERGLIDAVWLGPN